MSSINNYFYLKDVAAKYQRYRQTLPMNEKAIFAISSIGFVDAAECNPYYLAKNAMQRDDFTIYISSDSIERDRALLPANNNVFWVNPDNMLYLVALATSKYIITNAKLPFYFIKRKEQIVLNTWHGTPIKKLDKGLNIHNQSAFLHADYILCPNEHTKTALQEACFLDKLYTGKWLITGYPKNSIFTPENAYRAQRKYAYMPTWREDSTRLPQIEKYLERLDNYLTDNTTIYVKFHNLSKKPLKSYKHIKPFPQNVEPYSFLNTMDGLITDYSSVIFDFANTGKEIIIFAFDENSYAENPGLYFPLDKLPFPKYNVLDDLIKHLNKGKQFVPGQFYIRFLDEFCRYDTPVAAEQVNNFLLDDQPIEPAENSYITDNAANKETAYIVQFMPQIESARQLNEVKANIPPNQPTILVFNRDVTKNTRQLMEDLPKMQELEEKIAVAIITNATVAEKIKLALNNSYGFFAKTAQKVCQREKARIFPQLTISKFVNHSTEPLFVAMAKFFESQE